MSITYVESLNVVIFVPAIARLIGSYIDHTEVINPKQCLRKLWQGLLESKIPPKPVPFSRNTHYWKYKEILDRLGTRLLSAPNVALQLSRLYCCLHKEPMPCRKRVHRYNELSPKRLCHVCDQDVYPKAPSYLRKVYCDLCSPPNIKDRPDCVLGVSQPFYIQRTQVRSTEIPLWEFQYLQDEEPTVLILAAREIHAYCRNRP
jgi:hypothetical protein